MRNGLSQVLVTKDPAEFVQYLDDASIEVNAIDILDKETVMITFLKKKEWIEEHNSSNIGTKINI